MAFIDSISTLLEECKQELQNGVVNNIGDAGQVLHQLSTHNYTDENYFKYYNDFMEYFVKNNILAGRVMTVDDLESKYFSFVQDKHSEEYKIWFGN